MVVLIPLLVLESSFITLQLQKHEPIDLIEMNELLSQKGNSFSIEIESAVSVSKTAEIRVYIFFNFTYNNKMASFFRKLI